MSSPKSVMQFLLCDHSISRATQNRSKNDRMFEQVYKKESSLKTQRNIRHITQKRRLIQENWESIVHRQVADFISMRVTSEHAAIKIQKIVRGFLVRVKIEPLMLTIREKNSAKVVKNLREQTDLCMLSLGTATIPAIKKIQAAFRRYQIRKKLIIMHKAYVRHLKIREEIVCNFLRTALFNYNCKLRRDFLAFLEFRRKRLIEIKENIVILTVKKVWRAKKLSFKIVKEKFIRIKRRKAAMQNKEAYQKYLASMGGAAGKKEVKKVAESSSKDSKHMDESRKDLDGTDGDRNPEDDEEYKEAQRIKDIIDRKIREKIAKGKLAYAVPGNKTSHIVLPMMQERALNEDFEDDGVKSKLFNVTTSVFAKGRSLSREARPKTRNLTISSPKELPSRHFKDSALNCPRLSLYSPSEVPVETYPNVFIPQLENAHFLISTVASANRTLEPVVPSCKSNYYSSAKAEKKSYNMNVKHDNRVTRPLEIKEKKIHWIPVARRFSSYVPSLDNSAYVPPKWSPVQLDKRILHTAAPGHYEREGKNSKKNRLETRSPGSVVTPLSEYMPSHVRPHYLTGRTRNSVSPSTKEHSLEVYQF